MTNPEDGSLPGLRDDRRRRSLDVVRNRMVEPVPESPIMTREERWGSFIRRPEASRPLGNYRGNPATFALDIEFKLDSPDRRLVIKQADPTPSNTDTASIDVISRPGIPGATEPSSTSGRLRLVIYLLKERR